MGVLPNLYKLWPWVDLDLFYAKVKFGHIGLCMGKSENYLFFGTYCSFRSQSCLKHSAKWVYEVEWVSKVKVIFWSWSKVTQISKLNVWHWACILRWAIQGLRALLFSTPTHAIYNRLSPFKLQIGDEFYAPAWPGYGIFFAPMLENVRHWRKGAA